MPRPYIALAGNIGVGKTSLTVRLAAALGATPLYEPVDENPFLADFYRDMGRWGFHSQVFFLTHRVRQHHGIKAVAGGIVQDRTLYEDAEIFARNLHLSGHLDEREWRAYQDLYVTVREALTPPDAVVYLRASLPTLKARIAKRGRDFERGLTDAYLLQLNNLYEEWAATFRAAPIVTVETDDLDFVGDAGDLQQVLAKLRTAGICHAQSP